MNKLMIRIGRFWANDLPPVDGRVRLLALGLLTWLAATEMLPEAIARLTLCPLGMYQADGVMHIVPADGDDGPRLAAAIRFLRVPLLLSFSCASLGLFGRAPVFLAGLGVLFVAGAQRGCTGTGHAWYLPTYTLLILGCFSRPDAFSLDALLERRFPRYPFSVKGTKTTVVDSGLGPKLVLLCSVFMLFSAGLAKLLESGFAWAEGTTLQTYLRLLGAPKPWAHDLYQSMLAERSLARLASLGTLVLELGAPVALFVPRVRLPFVLAAWAFHLVIQSLMLPRYLPQMTCYLFLVDWKRPFANCRTKTLKSKSQLRRAGRWGSALTVLLSSVALLRFEAFPLSYVPMYSTRLGPGLRAGYPEQTWKTAAGLREIATTFERTRRPWFVKFALGHSIRIVARFPRKPGQRPLQGDVTLHMLRGVFHGDSALFYARLSDALAYDLSQAKGEGPDLPQLPGGKLEALLGDLSRSAPQSLGGATLVARLGSTDLCFSGPIP